MTTLAQLVETSRRVAGERGRNAKIAVLADFLCALDADALSIGVAYLCGAPTQGRLGAGHAMLVDAARTPVAAPPAPLLLRDVDAMLAALAAASGTGAKARRAAILEDLFSRATADERDFLARLLIGELRQGALESLVTDAVAVAASLPATEVRAAAMLAGGIARVAPALFTGGAAGLAGFALELMRPVAPMLAQSVDDVGAALRALGRASVEWKVDGARVHAHKSGDDVRVFTRARNDVTASVPEIVAVLRDVATDALVLDGEAIALDGGAPQPFQQTMRRFGRTVDVEAMRSEIPLSVMFFDCLRLGPKTLLGAPASERFDALAGAIPVEFVIPRLITDDVGEAERFYAKALHGGHEGVMVKSLSSTYDPGRRSPSWLKVKRLHTLDLVVLAVEWGHGRRRGQLSNLHLGARDAAGGFVMLGKTFKGMTDAMLAWQTTEFLAREIGRDGGVVHVRPDLVVEVAFNDLQASRRYPGGLALRFARVKRYRPDKSAADADTIDTVRGLYAGQLARAGASP